jgi:DNA-binding NtrC family response regulator
LLIIDDEIDMLKLLKRSLSEELQCEVETATKATEALQMLQRNDHDVVLADIRMPGMDGMEFLAHALEKKPQLTIVMMTAYGSIDLAVQSIKQGAYDFISKPFEHEKLTHLLKKALERSLLVRENLVLQDRIKEQESFHEIVGVSQKMRKLFDTLRLVSKTDVTILLTGESGTGKDMVARAIHALSDRRNRPFVAVNCPNLPENILESELFGYRRGAFTNATQDKKGLFLEAQGGTICLDEIGDIPLTLQTKLLSVLQEKEIRPLGQTANIKVDVRIIASTNQDLERKMKENLFREDLYYRLNVVSLHLPPLRERPEDIPILVEHFLERYCKEFHRPRKTVTPTLMNLFMSNPWRGNVRELENIVSRSVLLSQGDVIGPEDINWKPDTSRDCLVAKEVETLTYKEAKRRVLESFHREYLTGILTRHDGNITRAAKDCGLERQALQQVLRRYGIGPKDSRQ